MAWLLWEFLRLSWDKWWAAVIFSETEPANPYVRITFSECFRSSNTNERKVIIQFDRVNVIISMFSHLNVVIRRQSCMQSLSTTELLRLQQRKKELVHLNYALSSCCQLNWICLHFTIKELFGENKAPMVLCLTLVMHTVCELGLIILFYTINKRSLDFLQYH